MSKSDDEKEIQARLDKALQRSLKMPPKPHAPLKAKKPKAKTKPAATRGAK